MQKHAQLSLPNNSAIFIEISADSTEKDVAFFELPPFSPEDLRKPLEGLAQLFRSALQNVKPDKAAIEFALELGVESGQFTTLLVKGVSKAHVKVTMEWASTSLAIGPKTQH